MPRLGTNSSKMTESQSPSHSPSPEEPTQNQNTPFHVPVEIISDEEMALIEAAFAATRALVSSPPRASSSAHFRENVRSIKSITLLSNRSISSCSRSDPLMIDVEDSGRLTSSQKRNRVVDSLLHRFRRKRGLSVTDITATEWCEKKMEYSLLCGKPEKTKAMKAGSIRHEALEEEVIKKVKVHVTSAEDVWALKFLNFIVGANQLLFDGLTRELPLVGFAEGVWMVGVIDEIRMPKGQSDTYPMLVDTKTRVRASLPGEPQRRNGRLQLMCYKHLWDSLVADEFPSRQFFDFFSLNPYQILSAEIRENTAKCGFPTETLTDMLRYELQEDQSLLGEDQFEYDLNWVKGQIKSSLEVWRGEREASYTPEEERWKCRSCKFASECPASNSGSQVERTLNANC
ncbi:exonuclease V, chloroplastic isoform X2 [Nicotiana tomentosiformis]|uniref:exonuclease V, chloroplastic isoform X2 n=1 Tax=Nicotiana tomentosiformis TaxID=4098 RepID=UPI0008789F19|nr:exonuclease V, chloroplastic isoform X2 [Nicotiana tomentosiformis]